VIIVVQGLITIITLGFYGPWATSKYFEWRAQNTLVGDNASKFIGSGGSLFLFYLIHFLFLPLITLGIYYLLGFGFYRFYAWKEEHTLYGGERTTFGARYLGFLKVTLLTWILNAITFSIATPWTLCMLFRWQIDGLAVGDGEDVKHFPPVKTSFLLVAILVIIGLIPVLAIMIPVYMGSQQFGLSLDGKVGEIAGIVKRKTDDPKIKKKVKAPVKKAPTKTKAKRPRKPAKEKVTAQAVKTVSKKAKEKINYTEEFARLNELIKTDKGQNADLYYNRGWLYASKGDQMKAIEDYEKALKIDGKHADAYFNRGLLYVKMERYEMAVRDFNKAVELNPKAYDALCNSGNVYFELGKYDLAVRDYSKALGIKQDDADIYQNRSLAYQALGKAEKAKADEAKAARLKKEKAEKPAPPAGSVKKSIGWKNDLTGVKIPDGIARGMINGEEFLSVSAAIPRGILTIRDGKDFFPDHAVKIFLFLKKDESVEGRKFNVSRKTGVGVPHVHMQWKPGGKDVPETKIFTKDYVMLLEFGKKGKSGLPGKVYLCLPDDKKSFVAGSFNAKVN